MISKVAGGLPPQSREMRKATAALQASGELADQLVTLRGELQLLSENLAAAVSRISDLEHAVQAMKTAKTAKEKK